VFHADAFTILKFKFCFDEKGSHQVLSVSIGKSHFDVKICRSILTFFEAEIFQLFQLLARMMSYEG
jgi:hypothetical protein